MRVPVSAQTVRNWVKWGWLRRDGKGQRGNDVFLVENVQRVADENSAASATVGEDGVSLNKGGKRRGAGRPRGGGGKASRQRGIEASRLEGEKGAAGADAGPLYDVDPGDPSPPAEAGTGGSPRRAGEREGAGNSEDATLLEHKRETARLENLKREFELGVKQGKYVLADEAAAQAVREARQLRTLLERSVRHVARECAAVLTGAGMNVTSELVLAMEAKVRDVIEREVLPGVVAGWSET